MRLISRSCGNIAQVPRSLIKILGTEDFNGRTATGNTEFSGRISDGCAFIAGHAACRVYQLIDASAACDVEMLCVKLPLTVA